MTLFGLWQCLALICSPLVAGTGAALVLDGLIEEWREHRAAIRGDRLPG